MAYDFDKVIDRRGTSCSKWDADPNKTIPGVEYPVDRDVLPVWVADMDFEVAPEITEALAERVRHGIFGYTKVPDACYDAIIGWQERRHGWRIKREWITFTPGAVSAAHMAMQAYCQVGDTAIIQPPVYYPFYRTVHNNGGLLSCSCLRRSGSRYEMDFDDFERRAAEARTTIFILCSPHNPVGRVWREEELERIGAICMRHGVRVFTDELHCDIVMPGYRHVPFANLNPEFAAHSVTVISPSKTFNLAGLQATAAIIPDPEMRQRFENVKARNSLSDPNLFAITAMEVAYSRGDKWLDEVLAYIKGNYDFLVEYVGKKLPKVKVMPLEGTYLAWMDFSAMESDERALQKRMLTRGKVWLDEGWIFGEGGAGFERVVLACPRSILKEAVDRMARAFE